MGGTCVASVGWRVGMRVRTGHSRSCWSEWVVVGDVWGVCVSLSFLEAMTVVTVGLALERGRGVEVYSAMLVQCLAELFSKISDLRLSDLLYGGL